MSEMSDIRVMMTMLHDHDEMIMQDGDGDHHL